ncbi:MAG: FlgD immunoglobulin-like domain containing protein, partial [Candidatus Delongbacteria bacterium]
INDSTFVHTFTENGGYIIKAIVSDGVEADSTMWNITSYVSIEEISLPKVTQLHQNYPNPFNPETTISFDLAKQSNVNISVYNYNGALVRNLVNEVKNSGSHTVNWNGKNKNGAIVTTGMYIVVMKSANYSKVIKAIMVK